MQRSRPRIAATTSVVSAKIDYLPKMMNKHLIMLIIIYTAVITESAVCRR